ncbi:MAG: TolB-like 6-bladed beta-propeller domain-containing protein [Bacteroidales bacterium]|nr:TolB-like 6-bladed beta-propeller domain-containing protein [Bacteroidales bacterium]
MIKKIFLVLLTTWFTSCTNTDISKKRKLIEVFPHTAQLEGDFIPLDNMPIAPSAIFIYDTAIIITNSRPQNDYIFYTYNTEFKFIGRFGKSGRGPDEFVTPITCGQFEKTDSSIMLWVHDINKYKIRLVNVTQSLIQKKTITDQIIIEPRSIETGRNVFVLNENMLAGSSMGQTGRIFWHSLESKQTQWQDFFPEVSYDPIQDQLYNLYVGTERINTKNSKLVSALLHFKEIDVFNFDGSLAYSIVFSKKVIEPDFFRSPENPLPNSLKHYYCDLTLSNDFIYCLNLGISLSQRRSGFSNVIPNIEVFSWDGDAQSNFIADRFISDIAVSPCDDYILGLPAGIDSAGVIKYRLKGFEY